MLQMDESSHVTDSLSEEELQVRVRELEDEVNSFGQKRAYFMDIYKRKEGELFLPTETCE